LLLVPASSHAKPLLNSEFAQEMGLEQQCRALALSHANESRAGEASRASRGIRFGDKISSRQNFILPIWAAPLHWR
jgi:hypothetical protein